LNQIGPINIKPQIVKVIASLPGVYVLPYLDWTTFQSNKTALNNDPAYPLNAYPSHDFANGTMQVDPFNPGTHRYPQNIGFSMSELQHAVNIYRKVAAGPDAQYTNRFFNIRGIQTSPKTTPGSVSWGLLTGQITR